MEGGQTMGIQVHDDKHTTYDCDRCGQLGDGRGRSLELSGEIAGPPVPGVGKRLHRWYCADCIDGVIADLNRPQPFWQVSA